MSYVTSIIKFFNQPFFSVIGGLTVCFGIFGIFYSFACWAVGITPVMLRLGVGLARRRIAICADEETYQSLKATLVDSGIFSEKNVLRILSTNIDKAKDETLYLVDWETFGDHIERVFVARANHQTPIVIYAKPASIPHEKMASIANRANTVVVNFRGRLLNDILTSLMTTSYEKK